MREDDVADNEESTLDDLDSLLEPDGPKVTKVDPEEDLLGGDDDITNETEQELSDPEEPAQAPDEDEADQARIRELKAKLAEPTKPKVKVATAGDRPIPEDQLTPAQREIRRLEDELAKRRAKDAEEADTEYETAREGAETLLIHVLNDGLVINGQTTYRGQEFEFEVGGEAWNQTIDLNGFTYLSLVDDIDGQYDRWGEQKFARGPWRGRRGVSEKDIPRDLKDAEERKQWLADAKESEAAEQRRGRAAPVFAGF